MQLIVATRLVSSRPDVAVYRTEHRDGASDYARARTQSWPGPIPDQKCTSPRPDWSRAIRRPTIVLSATTQRPRQDLQQSTQETCLVMGPQKTSKSPTTNQPPPRQGALSRLLQGPTVPRPGYGETRSVAVTGASQQHVGAPIRAARRRRIQECPTRVRRRHGRRKSRTARDASARKNSVPRTRLHGRREGVRSRRVPTVYPGDPGCRRCYNPEIK